MLATLATTRTNNLLADGESTASALTSGYHLAFIIGAGLVAAAIAVAVGVLRPAAVAVEDDADAPSEQGEVEPAYSEAA